MAKPTKNKNGPASKGAGVFSYTNRKCYQYFIHQGMSKKGKTRYFTSRKPEGALSQIPDGYEITESINAVVSVQKPKPALIPPADLECVRKKVSSFNHLKHYKVEAKGKEIIVYQPNELHALEHVETSSEFSTLAGLTAMLKRVGRDPKDIQAEFASKLGMTVAELKKLDATATASKRKSASEFLVSNVHFSPILRFTWDGLLGKYLVHRRCFMGDLDWLELSPGSIGVVANKYVKHVGKESFFELM
jgi:hypothetical protein